MSDQEAPAKPRLSENDLDHALLREKLGPLVNEVVVEFGQTILKVDRGNLLEALRILRGDEALRFDMFTDVTATDNSRRADFEPARRFTVIHVIYSIPHGKRLRLVIDLPEQDPSIPSACGIYQGAAWVEREVFDMFGIEFSGHPDLRRVLLPDYYQDHPLRKDYPLTGRGERDNFVRAEELE